MTRKVFLILLALVLALSVGLVACGGGTPGQEEEEEEEQEEEEELQEDCIDFDYDEAEVEEVGGRWKIVVDSISLLDFDNNESEARQALQIIKHYGMNKQCFVGRPDSSMEYYLVDGQSPVGAFEGEDCVSFNPANIQVSEIDGAWKIVEGSHAILDFEDKENEARLSLEIIKNYGFEYICFVGRPDPSMMYFRRAGANDIHLDIVNVGAPAINCVFDHDCAITVEDTLDNFVLTGMSGNAFLQSRTCPPGESGTAGAGLYAYLYRINCSEMVGITHISSVIKFTINFGPVTKLDYDGDGNTDDVWVVTSGGLGNIAPSSARMNGNQIIFEFSPGVAAGSSPGNGDSSYFFGLASAFPPHPVQCEIEDNLGYTYTLDARAPDFAP